MEQPCEPRPQARNRRVNGYTQAPQTAQVDPAAGGRESASVRCSPTPGRGGRARCAGSGTRAAPSARSRPARSGGSRLEGMLGEKAIDSVAVVARRLRLAERPDRLRAVGRGDRDPDARARAVGVPLEVERDRRPARIRPRASAARRCEERGDRLEQRRLLLEHVVRASWRACARSRGSSRSARTSRCRRDAPR